MIRFSNLIGDALSARARVACAKVGGTAMPPRTAGGARGKDAGGKTKAVADGRSALLPQVRDPGLRGPVPAEAADVRASALAAAAAAAATTTITAATAAATAAAAAAAAAAGLRCDPAPLACRSGIPSSTRTPKSAGRTSPASKSLCARCTASARPTGCTARC